LTDRQRRFNGVHSPTQSVADRAFGRLKGKFRRMKSIDATRMCSALMVIEAVFQLHSFIQEHEDDGGESEDDDVCCDDVSTDAAARQCVRFVVYKSQCLSCAVTNYSFVKAFEN